MRSTTSLPAASLALLVAAAPALGLAQARSMSWRALDVEARLDAAGDLHVVERQEIVFTGAWNGGERTFRVARGQGLRFERLLREAPDGSRVPLARGDLDLVDRWAFTDARTLRWRSRAPGDPPFPGTTLVYVLEYTLSNVVVRQGEGRFLLDHDLAFPDRAWPIERVRAVLTVDPAWTTDEAQPIVREAARLAPGTAFVARIPLRWAGAGEGPRASGARPTPLRAALAAALAAALLAAWATWWRHGRRRGLFDDPPDAGEIDEAWLREHVLARSPEVIGAAWDAAVGAPEVAAVLARMASEGKLSTRVERVGGRVFGRDVMHLALRVDRASLAGYERDLVSSIFVAGDTVDTDRLRAHYRQKGFDPSSRIAAALRRRVASLAPPGSGPGWRLLTAGIALLVAGGVLLGVSLARDLDGPEWMISLHAVVAGTVVAVTLSLGLRRRVSALAGWGIALVVLLAAWGAGVLWVVGGAPVRTRGSRARTRSCGRARSCSRSRSRERRWDPRRSRCASASSRRAPTSRGSSRARDRGSTTRGSRTSSRSASAPTWTAGSVPSAPARSRARRAVGAAPPPAGRAEGDRSAAAARPAPGRRWAASPAPFRRRAPEGPGPAGAAAPGPRAGGVAAAGDPGATASPRLRPGAAGARIPHRTETNP